jgi:membrane protein implicated in regulation of membrane protease activity
VKSKFADGRWILIAIYNMFLTLAAFIPLFIVLVIDDGNLFIMTAVGINFSLASILLCLYLQRFIYLFESRQTSQVGGTTTTETS